MAAAAAAAAGNSFLKEKPKGIFTFGRFNPPTIGHKVLIDGLIAAGEDADKYVFVSSTQDNKKNPLTVEEKIDILSKQYPDRPFRLINTTVENCRSPVQAIRKLLDLGYEQIIFGVGSDRVEDFTTMISALPNEIKTKITVVPIGEERENNNETNSLNASKMSASKARKFALNGKNDLFSSAIKFGNVANANVEKARNTIRTRLTLSGKKRRAGEELTAFSLIKKPTKGGYTRRKARRSRKSFRSHK